MLNLKLNANALRPGKCVVALLVALAFCAFNSSTAAYAKKKAKYGTIKILSTPDGLPLQIDGKPFGNTTTEFRAIDLDPGVHTVVVTFPSGQLWTRDIDLPAGRIKCVTLTYRAAMIAPAKYPCPFPVSITAPSQVSEGEVITYTSDVVYSGSSPLTYTWTITPANARILSGAGTRM